jgi:hypothetical protein
MPMTARDGSLIKTTIAATLLFAMAQPGLERA